MATVFALRWRKVNWPPSGRGPGGGWTVGDDCETWRDASSVAGADAGGAGGGGGVSVAGMVGMASTDGGGEETYAMA